MEIETIQYAHYVYEIIKQEIEGLDSVYEDYIVHTIGFHGLIALKNYKLIEACGTVNGRQLYVLCDKE